MLYLTEDTETGGKRSGTASLLTAYFGIVDENFNFLHELDLKIRTDSDDEPYHVSAGALRVNKINLIDHDKTGVTMAAASEQLRAFLRQYKPPGHERFIPVGHNVGFDHEFIEAYLMSREERREYCSCFEVDTMNFAHFVYRVLKHPNPPRDFKLGTLGDHFGIPRGILHTAREDAILTVLVLKELKKLLETR